MARRDSLCRDQGQHDQTRSFAARSELRETARQCARVLPQRFCSSGEPHTSRRVQAGQTSGSHRRSLRRAAL